MTDMLRLGRFRDQRGHAPMAAIAAAFGATFHHVLAGTPGHLLILVANCIRWLTISRGALR